MWSDNETSVDLLGFQHLAGLVVSIVQNEQLLPATVGIFGDWGSGKSSLLEIVKADLGADEKTILVSFNGWQFEGYEDAKSALIGTILDELKDHKRLGPKAKATAIRLLKRLDLLRAAGGLLKYGVAFAAAGPAGVGLAAGADVLATVKEAASKSDDVELDDALKLIKSPGPSIRQTVREFRKDFGQMLDDTDGARLVVMIDDLDRCLPETIIETLEAIKLFLFVPRTAFVIGADERLVKYAVRKRFPELPGETSEVGRDYLEKLIQFPVRIPPLDRSELETYVNLLFAQLPGLKDGEFEKARHHVLNGDPAALAGVRFNAGVATELFEDVPFELKQRLGLAQRICPVLATGLSGNPRQCKRFLNTLMMRLTMARSRKVDLQQRILAKLMLLEYFKPEWFRRLAELQAAQNGQPLEIKEVESVIREAPSDEEPESDSPSKIAGRGKRTENGSQATPRPNEQRAAKKAPTANTASAELLTWAEDNWMRDWLLMDPALSDVDLGPYFFFSRDTLGPLGGAVRRMTPRAQEALNKLLHDSEAMRGIAIRDAKDLSVADAAAVFEALSERVFHVEDLSADSHVIDRIFDWVEVRAELRGQLITMLARLPEPGIPLQIPAKLVSLVHETDAAAAASQLLEKWEKSGVTRLAKAAQQRGTKLRK